MKANLSSTKIVMALLLACGLMLSGCATAVTSSNNSKTSTEKSSSAKKSTEKTADKSTSAKNDKSSSAKKKTASKTSKNSSKEAAKDGDAVSRKQVTLFDRIFRGRTLATTAESKVDDSKQDGKSGSKKVSKVKISQREEAEKKAAADKLEKEKLAKAKLEKDKRAKQVTEEAEVQTVSLRQLPSTVDSYGQVTRSGEVYLFRGLANVFSRGMDSMARKMTSRGLDARVYNHARWRQVADNIIAREKKGLVSYPIIIMGHSLGANASTHMAKYLGDRGIAVDYVVTFDPTIPTYVGTNVKQVTNYYLPNKEHDNIVLKTEAFKGKLRNVDMSHKHIGHLNIEKNYKLQGDSIGRVMDLTKSLPKSQLKRNS